MVPIKQVNHYTKLVQCFIGSLIKCFAYCFAANNESDTSCNNKTINSATIPCPEPISEPDCPPGNTLTRFIFSLLICSLNRVL